MNKVIVIAGATGVGKTKLSIELSKKYNGEIINADASQFHELLNIGTAKIKKEEMGNIKHYLIDFLPINSDYSIYNYQTDGRKIINDIFSNNKVPFIVGGSGLYVNALIKDYDLSSKKSMHNDQAYDSYSNEELYNLLIEKNPNLAKLTHQNNRQRVIRYLERNDEVKDISEIKDYYDYLIIFLNRDRESLYKRINERCLKMIEDGWIEECKNLISLGYDLKTIKEIGYKEIDSYLNNEISYDELIDLIQKETRHYAKRQITWIKNQNTCYVYDLEKDNIEDLYKKIDDFLK